MLTRLKEWFLDLFQHHNWNWQVKQIERAEKQFLELRDQIPIDEDKIQIAFELWETNLKNAQDYLNKGFKPHKNAPRRAYLKEQIYKLAEEHRKQSNISKIDSVQEKTEEVKQHATQVAALLLDLHLQKEHQQYDQLEKKAAAVAGMADQFKLHRVKPQATSKTSTWRYLLCCFPCFRHPKPAKKVSFADEPTTRVNRTPTTPAEDPAAAIDLGLANKI